MDFLVVMVSAWEYNPLLVFFKAACITLKTSLHEVLDVLCGICIMLFFGQKRVAFEDKLIRSKKVIV